MAIRTEIRLEGTATPLSHYTDAVLSGDLLFISGIAPIDCDDQIVAPGDVVGQTDFVLNTMGKILTQAGGGFEDVLRVTVYLIDVSHRAQINPVRQKYFGKTLPASTLIQVSALAVPGMLVEIEAVARLPVAS